MMTTKTCKCCRKDKPLSEFYVRADSADGHMRQCKKCKSGAGSARYRETKGKEAEEKATGWPLPAPADLSVQLAHVHMKRAYGAMPGQLRASV